MEANPLFVNNPEPVEGKKPLDKRILVLTILFSIIFVLLLASLVVTNFRQQPTINTTKPTPAQILVTPIIELNQAIPTQYQNPLNQIETEIKTQLEFAPPEIDQDIGL